jgi:hypothetical protein
MFARLVVILLLVVVARCAQAQSSYPVVSHAAQMERDLDRRLVLATELQAERVALAKAQAAFDGGPNSAREEEVHRRIENVKALQRELNVASSPRESHAQARAVVKALRAPAIIKADKSSRFWDPYKRVDTPISSANP